MGRYFDHNVGGLHDCDGKDTGLQLELVCCLTTHQGHDPVWAGLDLDLGHHGVADHPGDQANKAVPGRLRDRVRFESLGRRRELNRKPGQDRAVDALSAGMVADRCEATAVGPPTHGVITDPEQVGSLTDTEDGHVLTLTRTCDSTEVFRQHARKNSARMSEFAVELNVRAATLYSRTNTDFGIESHEFAASCELRLLAEPSGARRASSLIALRWPSKGA
jgi:hypothetical protein